VARGSGVRPILPAPDTRATTQLSAVEIDALARATEDDDVVEVSSEDGGTWRWRTDDNADLAIGSNPELVVGRVLLQPARARSPMRDVLLGVGVGAVLLAIGSAAVYFAL
jgi:hypothetical protein